jgi:hypothetical protein
MQVTIHYAMALIRLSAQHGSGWSSATTKKGAWRGPCRLGSGCAAWRRLQRSPHNNLVTKSTEKSCPRKTIDGT